MIRIAYFAAACCLLVLAVTPARSAPESPTVVAAGKIANGDLKVVRGPTLGRVMMMASGGELTITTRLVLANAFPANLDLAVHLTVFDEPFTQTLYSENVADFTTDGRGMATVKTTVNIPAGWDNNADDDIVVSVSIRSRDPLVRVAANGTDRLEVGL